MERFRSLTGRESVLLFMTDAADMAECERILSDAEIRSERCDSIEDLCRRLGHAGLLVMSHDVVLADKEQKIRTMLLKAPVWSHLPILILIDNFDETVEAMEAIGDSTLFEKPIRAKSFLRSVRSGLRDRVQQYAIRDQLAELHLREQRLDLAMRGINDGMFDLDLKTHEMFMMPRFKEIIGYKDDEFPNTRDAAVSAIHEDDRPKAVTLLEDYLAGRVDMYRNEFRMRHKDGSYRWVMSRAAAVYDEAGYPTRLTGTHTDITEQKMLEIKLEESEASFRQLADSIPQLAWMTDAAGGILWFNQRWFDYTGTFIEEVTGWGWQSVIDPHYAAGVTERFKRAIHVGLAWEDTFPIRGRNGEYRWFLSRAFPIQDENDVITHWFGTNTDITQQREREQQLQQSEERWKMVSEAMPQLVWIARGSDGACRYLSKQWEEYTGIPTDELLGLEWLNTLHPDDSEPTAHLWSEATAGRADYDIEYRIRRADGEYRWFKVRGVPTRNAKGKIENWYGTCTDIQDLVDAREKAAEANIAKTEFLANMSHEIRTPMNAVLGLASILANTNPLTVQQQECIKTLHLSAASLLSLINDLLDISKIEAQTVDLEEVAFSVADLTQEVVSMMSQRAQEKGIEFTFRYAADWLATQWFIGDPSRLRQILTNLCSNAIKFTEAGGVILTLDATKKGYHAHVSLAVQDSGIGIAKSQLEQIFHKFVQADSTINRKYGGTGLGLAITKTLAEIMGGGIEVSSEMGKGSVFTVSIPLTLTSHLAASEPVIQALPAAPSEPSARHDILLVEDYPANVLVASTFLEQFGYGCDVASNGRQAIDKFKNGRYAAILMDVQMHEMNGLEATRHIRLYEEEKGLGRIPIIGMTAHALAGDREKCLEAGMDDYLSKPFNPVELQGKLEERVNAAA